MVSDARIIHEYGEVSGLIIGKGNISTRTKPAIMTLCSPQIARDLAWDRARIALMGSRQLGA
jgi:hypothetical protein